MMKLALMRTGRPRTGRPRVTSAAEDKFIRVTSLRNRSSSSRHISTSTVQRRPRESSLHGGIAANKPLLRKNNKKKTLAWAKKHKEWTVENYFGLMSSAELETA